MAQALGLSQIYGFVRQSGGHVELYSEPGRGTTVKMYFPRAETEQEPSVGNCVSRGRAATARNRNHPCCRR